MKKKKMVARNLLHCLNMIVYAFVFLYSITAGIFAIASGEFTGFFIFGFLVTTYFTAVMFFFASKSWDVHDEFLMKKKLTDEYLKYKEKWWRGEE